MFEQILLSKMSGVILMLIVFVILYFAFIRPQMKKEKMYDAADNYDWFPGKAKSKSGAFKPGDIITDPTLSHMRENIYHRHKE